MKEPFVTNILKRIAPKIEAELFIEPEYGFVGRIQFKNGNFHYFRWGNLNINGLWAVEVVKDKAYTKFFLNQFWYQTPKGQTFFSEKLNKNIPIKRTIDDGYIFAKTIWFPVILKPNSKSQWILVTKVQNKTEYYFAAKKIFKTSSVLIVEEFCSGFNDYRIVVLDDKVISVYQRIPLQLIWDGKKTISELISQVQKEFKKLWRPERIDITDFRIQSHFKKKRYTLSTILKNKEILQLLDNANLSAWGTAIDFTDEIDENFSQLAIKSTHDMGLRLCWVDILCKDITKWDGNYTILELNGSPWLDNYASLGEKQKDRVDGMYLEILKALEKKTH